jgi:hypothetical protein
MRRVRGHGRSPGLGRPGGVRRRLRLRLRAPLRGGRARQAGVGGSALAAVLPQRLAHDGHLRLQPRPLRRPSACGTRSAATRARYRLAAAGYLLQPGTPFVYYGEEMGMAGVPGLPATCRCARPCSWTPDPRGAASPRGTPFRPVAPNVATHNAQAQAADPGSICALLQGHDRRCATTLPSIARGSLRARLRRRPRARLPARPGRGAHAGAAELRRAAGHRLGARAARPRAVARGLPVGRGAAAGRCRRRGRHRAAAAVGARVPGAGTAGAAGPASAAAGARARTPPSAAAP